MLFDDKTKHWQKEYRKGNLDDEDMPGELMALLDGSAERSMKRIFSICAIGTVLILIGMILFCGQG